MATQGSVYLIHFERPYKHATHYLGFTEGNAFERLLTHKLGRGARLLEVLNQQRISYDISRIWHNKDRTFERTLKCWKKSRQLCPCCNLNALYGIKKDEEVFFKGYTIKLETDLWALKYDLNVAFYNDEKVRHAYSLHSAVEEILDRTQTL